MGGLGSGRWSEGTAKEVVDYYRQIDVRKWHREGLLVPGTRFTLAWLDGNDREIRSIRVCVYEEEVSLTYDTLWEDGEWRTISLPIPLARTPCRYGGARVWFLCPGDDDEEPCDRRAAILYDLGPYLLCRRCCGLAYQSQRESRSARLTRKANKLYKRLGGQGRPYEPTPTRPKGMHEETYTRLLVQAQKAQRAAWIERAKEMRALEKRIEEHEKRTGLLDFSTPR